jgi:hypothetical protein
MSRWADDEKTYFPERYGEQALLSLRGCQSFSEMRLRWHEEKLRLKQIDHQI